MGAVARLRWVQAQGKIMQVPVFIQRGLNTTAAIQLQALTKGNLNHYLTLERRHGELTSTPRIETQGHLFVSNLQ